MQQISYQTESNFHLPLISICWKPGSTFFLPSAPMRTSNSYLLTGWESGDTLHFQPSSSELGSITWSNVTPVHSLAPKMSAVLRRIACSRRIPGKISNTGTFIHLLNITVKRNRYLSMEQLNFTSCPTATFCHIQQVRIFVLQSLGSHIFEDWSSN